MYLLGDINEGGYIHVESGVTRIMLHRETRNLHYELVTCSTLKEAQEKRDRGPQALGNPLIVKLTPEGGGERLYARSEDRETVSERLQVWKGCYGAWPVSFR